VARSITGTETFSKSTGSPEPFSDVRPHPAAVVVELAAGSESCFGRVANPILVEFPLASIGVVKCQTETSLSVVLATYEGCAMIFVILDVTPPVSVFCKIVNISRVIL